MSSNMKSVKQVYDEYKAFMAYDKAYQGEIMNLLKELVGNLEIRKTRKKYGDQCVVNKVKHLEAMAYKELYKGNIDNFKVYIKGSKDILNSVLNDLLFEEDVIKGVENQTSAPDKPLGNDEMAVYLGNVMKELEHNYMVSLRQYEIWLSRKPEKYDEFLKWCKEQDEAAAPVVPAVPAPVVPALEPFKKKRKGKKKKAGRRR